MKADEYISRNKILAEIAEIGGNVGSGWTTLGVIALVAGQPKVDLSDEVARLKAENERLRGARND